MNKLASLLLAVVVSLFPLVVLGAGGLQFDGETYAKQFIHNSPELRLAEYVRGNETVDNWTKLVAVRNYTKLSDPETAANDLAKALLKQNPQAKFQILTANDGSGAQIDFLTWTDDAGYLEFNIHRYLKVEGYPGLISYQFAYRLTDTSPPAMETFKRNRERWIGKMVKAEFEIDFDK